MVFCSELLKSKDEEMDFSVGSPPVLKNGQPLEYYKQHCDVLHDSSFTDDFQWFIGRCMLGDRQRVVHLTAIDSVVVAIEIVQIFESDTFMEVPLSLPAAKFEEAIGAKGIVSSRFSDRIILYDDFVRFGCDGGKIETVGWWDTQHWDQTAFIEAMYP